MNEENKKLEENIKRHIDVMLESVRGDFRVFGEKLQDVEKKVDAVKEDVELLKEDMDEVKSTLYDMRIRMKETDENISEHDVRITKLEKVASVV